MKFQAINIELTPAQFRAYESRRGTTKQNHAWARIAIAIVRLVERAGVSMDIFSDGGDYLFTVENEARKPGVAVKLHHNEGGNDGA